MINPVQLSILCRVPADTQPDPGFNFNHVIFADADGAITSSYFCSEGIAQSVAVEPDEVIDQELLQSAFLGVLVLWGIGLGIGLIIGFIRKLRV